MSLNAKNIKEKSAMKILTESGWYDKGTGRFFIDSSVLSRSDIGAIIDLMGEGWSLGAFWYNPEEGEGLMYSLIDTKKESEEVGFYESSWKKLIDIMSEVPEKIRLGDSFSINKYFENEWMQEELDRVLFKLSETEYVEKNNDIWICVLLVDKKSKRFQFLQAKNFCI